RVLAEREFLRAVEQAAAQAWYVPVQRELVVEQQERIPGGRDLREVVEQEGKARLLRVVVGIEEVDVVRAERARARGHRDAFQAGSGPGGGGAWGGAPPRARGGRTRWGKKPGARRWQGQTGRRGPRRCSSAAA